MLPELLLQNPVLFACYKKYARQWFQEDAMKKFSFCLTLLFCFCFFILLACSSARITPVNVDADGVAIKGYDPVAYFTMGGPVKGQKEFQQEWQGATWRFSSQEHLALFQANPEKYAPQYGGY
jgi:YHS domain-containing protein